MDTDAGRPDRPPHERALGHVATLSLGPALDPALRVTLNFHPDRLIGDRPILLAMAEDDAYLSQFATGTSNGGLTAHPGGDRWIWESTMFAGAYDEAAAYERPVYGALNFRHKPFGGAPRFGSAHFRLGPEALPRSTFCYPDSVALPTDFGVSSAMALIELAQADEQDALDDYVEAHVHGPLRLSRDAEALVLDPCYQGTQVEKLAGRLGIALEWHPGWRLSVDELRRHPEYRGPEFVDLGAEIAEDGYLNPLIIGTASRSGRFDQQALKRVWHYLARFGEPAVPEFGK